MDPERLRYWLEIAIGIPMALMWTIIVASLSYYAARGDSPRALRVAAIWSVICAAATTVCYAALVIVRPAWYETWMGRSILFVTIICFFVSLSCLILSKNPPKSAEERRLTLGMMFYVLALNSAMYLGEVLLTDWQSLALLPAYAILIAIGCIVHHKFHRRLMSDPQLAHD